MNFRGWLAAGGILGLGIALYGLAAILVTQPLVGRSTVRLVPPCDPGRLEVHVRQLAVEFAPRDHRHTVNLDRVAAYIGGLFGEAGGRVAEQVFVVKGRTYRNVSGRFGPEAGERIVVGAHYDAYGPFPGADDNASAVAGILELARMLKENPPMFPVELVAFTLEEPPSFGTGNMGSVRHAKALKAAGVRLRAMLCLEMIGCFKDEAGSQSFPLPLAGSWYGDQGDFIAVVGRWGDIPLVRRVKGAMAGSSALPVRSMTAPRWVQGIDFSDHRSYWDQGYPAVMITDGAFFRNRAYHTEGDTPERLDYRRMALAVQAVFGAVQDLAGR